MTRALLQQAATSRRQTTIANEPVDPYTGLGWLPEQVLTKVKEIDARIADLNEAKETAVAEQNFEKAAHLRDQADKLNRSKGRLVDEARRNLSPPE